jgi:pimeloyl-ACP methyl ester carboxylesterase
VGVDEHSIELAGSPVFYRAAPPEAPPEDATPLYLHGLPTSSDDWLTFLERTGGIAPDLIGFGRSSKAGNLDYSLDGLAGFVHALLDELAIDRVKLVGHDWGAGAGLRFAQAHPGRLERLVICNAQPLPPGFRWPRLARLWRRPVVGELAMGSTTRWLLARALRRGSVRSAAWPEPRIAAVWEQFDQGTQRAILRLHRSVQDQEIPKVEVPTLVVWGEQDPWLPPAVAEAYAAQLPNSTLERVADAGHWPWLDEPELIERIALFLKHGL